MLASLMPYRAIGLPNEVSERKAKPKIKISTHCPSTKELNKRAKFCEDNSIYADASVNCLEFIEREVVAEQKLLDRDLKRNLQNSANSVSQENEMSEAKTSYQEGSNRLQKLQKLTELAKSQVESYRKNIVFPAPDRDPNMPIPLFINLEKCWREPSWVIESVTKDMTKILDDLERGRLAAVDVESGAESNASTLESTGTVGPSKKIQSSKQHHQQGLKRNRSDIKENHNKK
jgi:hypothetical protein